MLRVYLSIVQRRWVCVTAHVVCILCCLFVGPQRSYGFQQVISLSSPSQTLTLPGAFTWARTYPSVANGYLVSFTRSATAGKSNTIFLMSLANSVQHKVSFNVPGSQITILDDVSVSAGGDLIVAGSYATGTSSSHFLDKVSLDGNVLSAVALGDYEATRVCSTADGSTWTLGQSTSAIVGSDYLVRRYDATGSLSGSYLSRNSLPRPTAILNLHSAGKVFGQGAVAQSHLACGSASVGVYIGSPENLWFEVTVGGDAHIWPLPSSSGLTSLVLGPPGSVRATIAGLGAATLLLGTTSGTWVPLPDALQVSAAKLPAVGRFLGVDGLSVVYARGNQGIDGDRPLYWSAIE